MLYPPILEPGRDLRTLRRPHGRRLQNVVRGVVSNVCSIGYATSPEGINWTDYAGNPVLAGYSFPPYWYFGNPTVLYDGSVYRMWMTAGNASGSQIAYATSPDGIRWSLWPSNILRGTAGTWDANGVDDAKVVRVGTAFLMVFEGHNASYVRAIGVATSPDATGRTIPRTRSSSPRCPRFFVKPISPLER